MLDSDITIIGIIEQAIGLHSPKPEPDEYPEYSRGMANIIADAFGFDQDDIPLIIQVIRQQMRLPRFAVQVLQTPWMSDPHPSERQIRTRRELSEWLVAEALLAEQARANARDDARASAPLYDPHPERTS